MGEIDGKDSVVKACVKSARNACLASAALLGALCGLPTASQATTFNYTAASGDVVGNFSFTTSLSGAALDNLAPGTSIPFTAFTIAPTGLQQDTAGFPIGGSFGSSYFNASNFSLTIGTNSLGQITSWDITENVFASWPAFPGENPNDFFGTYSISLTNTGDTRTLLVDNDVGFAPGNASSGPGSFGASVLSTTPLPATLPLFAGGLGFVGYLTRRRKRSSKSALAAA
jgi:hypothetical protein